MDRISGWWVGATEVPSRSELWACAQAVGGWARLEGCGVRELCELGIEPEAASRWVERPDATTMGVAITRADPRYPSSLQADERSPPVLYAQGRVELMETPGVAVVGTRKCSERGSAIVRHLGRELAQQGVVIVSGLALGIDTAAHQGALRAGGGRTIAVLGHGLGHQAPPSNARLRAALVEQGGLVLSGWPDAMGPARWTFPARNRWIAGLSRATVMVEGTVRSGAGITAKDALELGTDVWAVPGPPDQPVCEGPLQLLDRQACDDVELVELLRMRLCEAIELVRDPCGASPIRLSALSAASRSSERGRVRILQSVRAFVDHVAGAGPRQEEAWLDQLFAGSTVEQVARSWSRPVLQVQAELTRLELRGELVRLPGGRYARA